MLCCRSASLPGGPLRSRGSDPGARPGWRAARHGRASRATASEARYERMLLASPEGSSRCQDPRSERRRRAGVALRTRSWTVLRRSTPRGASRRHRTVDPRSARAHRNRPGGTHVARRRFDGTTSLSRPRPLPVRLGTAGEHRQRPHPGRPRHATSSCAQGARSHKRETSLEAGSADESGRRPNSPLRSEPQGDRRSPSRWHPGVACPNLGARLHRTPVRSLRAPRGGGAAEHYGRLIDPAGAPAAPQECPIVPLHPVPCRGRC